MPSSRPASSPSSGAAGVVDLLLESPRSQFLLLLLLAVAVFFADLWIGDLGLDSCAYATISRTILRTGDWVVPHYEHSREYADCWLHPPLYYWLTAIAFSTVGPTEFGARLIPSLLGLGSVLLVFGIGRRIGGPRVGFASGLVLLTTQPYLELARKCQMDVPLAFFITLSIFFVVARRSARFPTLMDILAGAAAGGALLTKGVPGLVVIALAVLYAWIDGDWKSNLPVRMGSYLLALLAVLSIWVVPLALRGKLGEFGDHYFRGQIWANFSGTEPSRHLSPFERLSGYGWYLKLILRTYWPWVPFLLFAAGLALRTWRTRGKALFFLAWILVVLGGFGAGQTRYPRYLAPFYPAAALLIGGTLAGLLSCGAYRRVLRGTGILLFLVLFAASTLPGSILRFRGPDRTDLKAMTPAIRRLCPSAESIEVFGLEHWDATASLAFYADRSMRDAASEEEYADHLREKDGVGYLEATAYDALSASFRREFVPLYRGSRMLLIVGRSRFEALRDQVVPIRIPFGG